MEPLHEQVAYGGYCEHGTAIGTPGGADLMCGYCEEGLTLWVADPTFRLWAILTNPETGEEHSIQLRNAWLNSSFRDDTLGRKRILRSAYTTMRRMQRLDWAGFQLAFEARQEDSGYWDYPLPEEAQRFEDLGAYYERDDE